MIKEEFDQIIKQTPNFKAQFKLKKVPLWLRDIGIHEGDTCLFDSGAFQFNLPNGKKTEFNLNCGDIEFVSYIDVNEGN